MPRILHLCGSFDPAGDVIRCFKELQRVSEFEHDLVIRAPHPLQRIMKFEEPEQYYLDYPREKFEQADAVICHLIGWPIEWVELPRVPMAFRNLNIRYSRSRNKFWSEPQYTAQCLDPFKLVSGSHVGAEDIVGSKNFFWLPDLLPIHDSAYTPDWSEREDCVSFIKHHQQLSEMQFLQTKKLCLNETSHAEILKRRKREATVVIDNLCDGHWGLAGHEAIALGLPTLVWNHARTHIALRAIVNTQKSAHPVLDDESLPFSLVETDRDVQRAVDDLSTWPRDMYRSLRHAIRSWTERHLSSKNLVPMFWDPFCERLLKAG